MNKNCKFIIELSKKALLNKSIDTMNITLTEEEWGYLFIKLQEQSVIALIAESVISLPKALQPNNIDDWRDTIIKTVYVMGKKNIEYERVVKLLCDVGITPLCLKGAVIKDLYPTPELRTMGDFDILIDADKRKKAEYILQENGYELKRDTLYTAIDKNGAHGEIFSSLEDDFRINPEYWDNEIKNNTYFKDNRLLLTPSYEFAYSIVHAAKHLTREGCGIRNLFDVIVLLKNRDGIDLKLVEKICKVQGYENVLYYMLTAAECWYGISVDATIPRMNIDDTERFVEYMLSYGIFGRDLAGNVLSRQVLRREGNGVCAFRRIFFPPAKMMWHKYRYLKKTPWLLPVAWIHRFITAVFIKKYSVKGMLTGIDESIRYGKERDNQLDELGLK
jgi:hypothetical protein